MIEPTIVECNIFIIAVDPENFLSNLLTKTTFKYYIVLTKKNEDGKLDSEYRPSLEICSMGNQPESKDNPSLTEAIANYEIDNYYGEYHKDGVSKAEPIIIGVTLGTLNIDYIFDKVKNCNVNYRYVNTGQSGVVKINTWQDLGLMAMNGNKVVNTKTFFGNLEKVKTDKEYISFLDFIQQLSNSNELYKITKSVESVE